MPLFIEVACVCSLAVFPGTLFEDVHFVLGYFPLHAGLCILSSIVVEFRSLYVCLLEDHIAQKLILFDGERGFGTCWESLCRARADRIINFYRKRGHLVSFQRKWRNLIELKVKYGVFVNSHMR